MTEPDGNVPRSAAASSILAELGRQRRDGEKSAQLEDVVQWTESPAARSGGNLPGTEPAAYEQPMRSRASESILSALKGEQVASSPQPPPPTAGERDSSPRDVIGASERPRRVSWLEQRDPPPAIASVQSANTVPPAPKVRAQQASLGAAESRSDEVSQIRRREATRLLDIVGETHFQVSGDAVNSRLSSPPEQ